MTAEGTKEIIRRWYRLLEVPAKYDRKFEEALETVPVPAETSIETYDPNSTDGAKNFLSFLYMCEEAKRRYQEHGVAQEIIIASLKDLWAQAERYYRTGKEFYLGELGWLKHHMRGEIFKLGRLQFAFGTAEHDSPEHGLKKGEPVMEVHIDEYGPLDPAECDRSFAMAEEFFRKHFPEYRYDFYTCHSWILGSNVERLLPEKSNLRSFRRRFDLVTEEKSDDILQYVFKWNTTRENLGQEQPGNAFAEKVKKEAESGADFYLGYGVTGR